MFLIRILSTCSFFIIFICVSSIYKNDNFTSGHTYPIKLALIEFSYTD